MGFCPAHFGAWTDHSSHTRDRFRRRTPFTQDKNGLHQEFEPAFCRLTPSSASTSRFVSRPCCVPSTNKSPLPEGAQVSWRTKLTRRA
jgi:hypothetical protein